MPAWFLWSCLVILLVAPVIAAFAEDRPPRNEITQEQEPRDPAPKDGDAEMRAAALRWLP
jgi:hypothetical protein